MTALYTAIKKINTIHVKVNILVAEASKEKILNDNKSHLNNFEKLGLQQDILKGSSRTFIYLRNHNFTCD